MSEEFMNAALEVAEKSYLDGEVPVGAVFVYEGKIISSSGNLTNESQNVSYFYKRLLLIVK